MKEETKTKVAKEIVINFKLIVLGILIGLLATGIYAVKMYPPKTHYTRPDYYSTEWPASEEGDAVFPPENARNVGRYFSAYISNSTKYDDAAMMKCVLNRDYSLSLFPTISDVINEINKTRLELYKKDVISFFEDYILYIILLLVLGRYLLNMIKWVVKYNR